MKLENKIFLDQNRHHWITLRDAQYLRGLNVHEREGMLRVMQEEFYPGYMTDLWCPDCIADMVRMLYQRYEQWERDQPKAEPIVVEATFPKHEPPVKINKRRR